MMQVGAILCTGGLGVPLHFASRREGERKVVSESRYAVDAIADSDRKFLNRAKSRLRYCGGHYHGQ